MEKIIQEKISADHLLYVGLKYTKTTDVMLNLIARWKSMIETSINRLLEHAKKKKKIKAVSLIPKMRLEQMRGIFKKNPSVLETIETFEFFKRVPELQKVRENEFRKNVTLKILDRGKWVNIDMDKLKEYSELLEKFISNVKQFL